MVEALSVFNYGLVLLFGVFLSISFSGGCSSARQYRAIGVLCLSLLGVQALCWSLFGLETTTRLYPFISHLPLVVTLALVLKKPWGVALVSVLTAYFCCQLPLWLGALALYLFKTLLAEQLVYLFTIFPLFFLLRRHFAAAVRRAMTYSSRSLLFFGALPLLYYLFDYATTVFTNALYEGVQIVSEFLPAVMALFYIAFVSVYHSEVQRRNQTELQNSLLAMQLAQSNNEMSSMRQMQEQTAAYRHDMRHHLAMIGGYLMADDKVRALDYIKSAQSGIDSITPRRYCENIAMNVIFAAFAEKAAKYGAELNVEANIPANLPLLETELCALFSNSLENAIVAAAQCERDRQKTVRVNCQPHKGMLLISISNPFEGELVLRGGLPRSSRSGHGLGVKSIQLIAQKHGGDCFFDAQNGIVTLQIVLPLES